MPPAGYGPSPSPLDQRANVKLNRSSSNSPRQRRRTTELHDKRNKKHYFDLQNVSNKQLFITWPHGPNTDV
jgi:hypothetical protein